MMSETQVYVGETESTCLKKRFYLSELASLFSLGKYPAVELLGHTVILCLIFSGTSIMFLIVASPVT